jgi:hypothetical protein
MMVEERGVRMATTVAEKGEEVVERAWRLIWRAGLAVV